MNAINRQTKKLRDIGRQYPRQFWLIASGILLSSAGSSLIWPFQMIYMSKKLALPISSVTTLISISSVMGLFASLVAGAIADRFGRKFVMMLAQGSHGIAYILMSQASTYAGFLLPMTIMGAAMPFYSVGSDAMMADIIPSEKRADAYAILRMFNNTGISVGPAIGGLIVLGSYQTAFIAAACCMITYSLILMFFVHESLHPAEHTVTAPKIETTEGFKRVLGDRGFISFVMTLTLGMIAPMMMWLLLSVYMNKYFGIKENMYSWLPIANALMCVFIQYPITQLTKKLSAKTAISLGMVLYAIGVGSVALMSTFFGFLASMIMMTFGELVLVPNGSKYVADISPEKLRGRYMSVYWLTWNIARSIAPLYGGYLHDRLFPSAIWLGGLALGLISALGLYIQSRRDQSVQVEVVI